MGNPQRRRNRALLFPTCLAITALVGWLVYVLLGEVHNLAAQAACVLTGGLAIAGVWHVLGRDSERNADAAPRQVPVRSLRHHLFWLAYIAWFGADSVHRIHAHQVGERPWWGGVIGVTLCSASLVFTLVELYRERHARAEQRKDEWAPWG